MIKTRIRREVALVASLFAIVTPNRLLRLHPVLDLLSGDLAFEP